MATIFLKSREVFFFLISTDAMKTNASPEGASRLFAWVGPQPYPLYLIRNVGKKDV